MEHLDTQSEAIQIITASQYPNSIDKFYEQEGIQKAISFMLEVQLRQYTGFFCPYKEIFEARWTLFTLSNGGFYYKPIVNDENKKFKFRINSNYFEGELNAEEIGLIVSLFAINQLCYKLESKYWIDAYYLLRDFALDHSSGEVISRAID